MRGVEGVRGIAALAVVVHHAGLYAVADGTTTTGIRDVVVRQLAAGVLLFFALSGLLLYRPFADAILGVRPLPRPGTFLRNRALRILPAFWVILLVVSALGASVVPDPDVLRTGSLFAHPTALVANLLLVHGYSPSTMLTGIGPAWTLVIEVCFYLALPVLSIAAWWVAGRAPRRRTLLAFAPVAALVGIGLVGKGLATELLDGSDGWSRTWPSVLARSFLANADLFAAGMAVAVVAALVDAGRLRMPAHWRPMALAGAAVIVVAMVASGEEFTVFRYDQLGSVAAALALAPMAIDVPDTGLRAVRWLERPVVAWLGLISYSVYLWHQPVIDWWVDRGVLPVEGGAGLAAAVGLVGVTTLLLSAATYRWVERPALARKRSTRADRAVAAPA